MEVNFCCKKIYKKLESITKKKSHLVLFEKGKKRLEDHVRKINHVFMKKIMINYIFFTY